MGKKCDVCRKKCSGDVLKANDKLFHVSCFQCKKCQRLLGESGYYQTSEGYYLCPDDYRGLNKERKQSNPATPAKTAEKIVHGKSREGSPSKSPQHAHSPTPMENISTTCAACVQPLAQGQALLALNQSWHVFCFKCSECGAILHGEYMSHNGQPLCLRDYNDKHGVKCYECHKFIAGKVLQAGNYRFHPTCARCTRCGLHFGGGEEMYMQGDEIWHPSCEHSRTTENIAPTAKGSTSFNMKEVKYPSSFGQHTIYMYLMPEPELTYMRHPATNQKEPNAPQYHVPQGPIKIRKSRLAVLKTGMQRLAEDLEKDMPRPKSPHMCNEEPIELAHYPAGHAPDPNQPVAIERDDFPAPPYPYAVEELKRRLSTSSIENEISDDESDLENVDEDKLKKTVKELEKYEDSSIAHVIKQNIEEATKRQRLPLHWDPRNASRTPSAKKMPHLRFRYEVPINASPSRHMSRPRPWVAWQGGERNLGNTLPCFHIPESQANTLRASTLPGRCIYGHQSMENLEAATTENIYNTSGSNTFNDEQTRIGGDMRTPLRSSLPDMSKPVKTYSLTELQTTNKAIPNEVDRQHLERHLTRDEFEAVFNMSPIEFYKLPEWKRINLKRKARLF
ncbi:unnamed protein product [Auanema sp. JU1783]|nr:unnamed protein product [Auanema sp. JU1783]